MVPCREESEALLTQLVTGVYPIPEYLLQPPELVSTYVAPHYFAALLLWHISNPSVFDLCRLVAVKTLKTLDGRSLQLERRAELRHPCWLLDSTQEEFTSDIYEANLYSLTRKITKLF